MTERESYLEALRKALKGRMHPDELERVIVYYEEYFDEGGPEGAAGIIAELGQPEELAVRLLGRDAGRTAGTSAGKVPPAPSRAGGGWPWGLALLLVPLFLLLALLLGIVAIAAVLGCLGGGVIAAAAGVFTLGCGFSVLFSSGLATTRYFGGIGLLAGGVGVLLAMAALALGRVCLKGAAALAGTALRGGRRKET